MKQNLKANLLASSFLNPEMMEVKIKDLIQLEKMEEDKLEEDKTQTEIQLQKRDNHLDKRRSHLLIFLALRQIKCLQKELSIKHLNLINHLIHKLNNLQQDQIKIKIK